MNLPSKLIEDAVEQFATLPGIGRRTALRLVLSLLKNTNEEVETFGKTLINLRNKIGYCRMCHNISDTEFCSICSNINRDKKMICVVESITDVIAIENTGQYNGLYHVLYGVISPMDGIGPTDINAGSLVTRVGTDEIIEVIMALPSTMEGDTTIFYLFNKLKEFNVKISIIARGVAVGDDLEFIDEVTLGRSLVNRTLYDNEAVK